MERWVFTGGAGYRVGDGEQGDIVDWAAESAGELMTGPVKCLSIQDVLARLGVSALPKGFPTADVIIGVGKTGMRGWFETTVSAWEADPGGGENAATEDDDDAGTTPAPPVKPAPAPKSAPGTPRAPWWTGVSPRSDALVAIVTSRGVVLPSGEPASKGPLTQGTDLAKFVWYRWPRPPAKNVIPQVWLTAPALQAAGMKPPKAVASSEDLSKTVSTLFGCTVTSAKAGWFTAVFPPDSGTGEARRVHLVLLPFLWTDPSGSRPKDLGMAGMDGAETELPDDEFAAAKELGQRIAWLAELADTAPKYIGEAPLLPARRPGSVGAALLDKVRRRETTAHRIEVCPIPTKVYTESQGRLETATDWRQPHASKKAKGDAVDVEVDQRAAYLASASGMYLGYGGEPEEFGRIDAVSQFRKDPTSGKWIQPAFGLWNITIPAGSDLEGLDPRLPLPLPDMKWDEPATVWCTTRSVQQLLAPVTDGGAGMVPEQLEIGRAYLWPKTWRALRGWAEILREALKQAIDDGDQFRENFIKDLYKGFLGRLDSSDHPMGQKHYQQPVWAATVRAETRWRALRYAHFIAGEHGLYPLVGKDIDTWVYRLPPDLDPTVLNEASTANGKYRIKKVRASGSGT